MCDCYEHYVDELIQEGFVPLDSLGFSTPRLTSDFRSLLDIFKRLDYLTEEHIDLIRQTLAYAKHDLEALNVHISEASYFKLFRRGRRSNIFVKVEHS